MGKHYKNLKNQMKPKNRCLYYYCHSGRTLTGRISQTFRGPLALDVAGRQLDILYRTYRRLTEKAPEAPPPVLGAPDLPVRAVRRGHHPARAQHGGPACVPGAQGHAGLPGPAPGSRRLPAHDPGSQRPGPTLCKQRSTREMDTEVAVSTVLSAGECGRLPFIIPGPKHGVERPSR